jgi:hypothetical protein
MVLVNLGFQARKKNPPKIIGNFGTLSQKFSQL